MPAMPGSDWGGLYSDDTGTVALFVQGAQGAYTGVLQFQGRQFQFEAHLDDLTLHGLFTADGGQYEFWADRDGPMVLLYLGDNTFVLQQRQGSGTGGDPSQQWGAQAGYGTDAMYPAYPMYPVTAGDMNSMDPMAQMDAIGQQIQAQLAFYEQQMAAYDQQAQARLAEINKYFIDLYRSTTGDYTSSDEVALYYGQAIHCQQYPVDCQIAAQNSAASSAALAANNAAFQQRMAEQGAAWDARNEAWAAGQASQEAAHQNWLDTTIRGVDDYSSGAGGPTYQLPFAPAQGTYYQTPAGQPLVFDSSANVWYQVNQDGSYTPYYQVP